MRKSQRSSPDAKSKYYARYELLLLPASCIIRCQMSNHSCPKRTRDHYIRTLWGAHPMDKPPYVTPSSSNVYTIVRTNHMRRWPIDRVFFLSIFIRRFYSGWPSERSQFRNIHFLKIYFCRPTTTLCVSCSTLVIHRFEFPFTTNMAAFFLVESMNKLNARTIIIIFESKLSATCVQFA